MLTSFDQLDDDLPSIDTAPEKVELDVDVLAPVVENQILHEGDGGRVCQPLVLVGEPPHQSARPAAGAATQLGTPLWPPPHTLPRTWTAPSPSVSATTMKLESTRGT